MVCKLYIVLMETAIVLTLCFIRKMFQIEDAANGETTQTFYNSTKGGLAVVQSVLNMDESNIPMWIECRQLFNGRQILPAESAVGVFC